MRGTIALSALLALASAWGCHRPEPEPESQQGSSAPSGLPRLAEAAMKKARRWHADAILVNVEVASQGGPFETTLEFYAPSDFTGYLVREGIGPESDQALGGAVSWGTEPIPLDFPDFPDVVAAMRARGMKGPVIGGTLTAVKLCGMMPVMRWEVLPSAADQPGITDYDVYFYANPRTAPRPMDWHQVDDLADKTLKGDIRAWASLREAAQRGDPNAATNVGYVFGVGAPGVPKDFLKAGPWFCAAAYQGSPAAEFNLGLMLDKGWGVGPGYGGRGASNLYYPAAAQGVPEAQVNLGVMIWMIQADLNFPKNAALVRQWWQKAAAQGSDAANKNIAAISAWNEQTTAFSQVPLIESTAFIEARNWNPSSRGMIPHSAIFFPDRFPPNQGWSPAE